MSYSVLPDLRKIADMYHANLKIDEHESGDYVDCILKVGEIDLYIIATRIGNDYLAYGMETTYLPRELYSDSIKNAGFTEQDRNREILENVKNILSKKLSFYPRPSFFNKNRGYIKLKIDSVETKLFQKRNSFGLNIQEDR